MAWETSNRRSELPSDWDRVRKRILRRDDYACQARLADGGRCGEDANQVDHMQPGGSHEDWNLQALCEWHHRQKSSGEGGAAQAVKRRQARNRFKRVEQHPGML